MKKLFYLCLLVICTLPVTAQSIFLQGYVFETDNRGYINQAKVDILESPSKLFITSVLSDQDGFFSADVPEGANFLIRVSKDLFVEKEMIVEAKSVVAGQKKFVNIELERKPGYIFDVTLADPRINDTITTSGVHGATIEVYNNTTEEEYVSLKDYEFPNFKVTFEQGNHYTLLIRKEGYYAKRMEAYVNVKGCILCFDGVGNVQPGVSDVLTAGHQMGTLLANVELKPIVLDEKTKLENINYALGSAKLNSAAKEELRIVINLLEDNPGMKVELSSHTDSRGEAKMNMELSERRAKIAKEFIINSGQINPQRIIGKGYGETRLDNGCKDGVPCSERQHRRNRRTEIKILEFNQPPKAQWKSLAELKRLEKMDQMLKDLQNQEIVQIPAEAANKEVPEDLKKALDKEQIPTASDAESIGEKEEVADEIEMVTNPAKSESEKAKLEKRLEENVTASTTENKDVAVAESSFKKLKMVPNDYSGYRIQIIQSSIQLQADNDLFKVFGNLTLEKLDNGYAYLIGDFRESKDANLFLDNIIKPRYPEAILIQYLNGQRV